MKTLNAKYPGYCATCNEPIKVGQRIHWARGYTAHVDCRAARWQAEKERSDQRWQVLGYPREPDAPCWICKDPCGWFRSYGAATPVYCDECHANNKHAEELAARPVFAN